MQTFQINTLEQLAEVATTIVALTKTNNLFCFYGNLGAGKTTLIKYICEQLEVVDTVTSPTYPIINEYKTAHNQSIYHIDLYRIKSVEEALQIGIEDYIYSGNCCFIEWPDNFESLFIEKHIKIKISKLDEANRNIVIE